MLGDISAIATLTLFVIYFIGRVITILMERDICYDEIRFLPLINADKYDIVEEFQTVALNGDIQEEFLSTVILTSKQGIRNISVFKLVYDNEGNEIKKNAKTVGSYGFLNIGQSFAMKTFVPELIPQYRIVYYTQDFKKVTLNISENLKSGVVSEMLQPKHTFKSVFYYLFR